MPLLLLALIGCKKVDEAPEDLDDLLHYIWVNLESGDDELLAEAAVNLNAAIGGDTLDEGFDGTLSLLSEQEIAVVGVTDQDPDEAHGIFLANTYSCDLKKLEEILSYPDQDQIYSGYDAYNRDYDSPHQDWRDSVDAELQWDLEYEATLLLTNFKANARGKLRRVLAPEPGWGYDSVVFARIYFPEPAEFQSDGKSMEQDYQLEIWWERGGNEIVHTYGMWRQANFGAGYTTEDEGIQRTILNSLFDWDGDTEKLCKDELP